MGLWIMNGDVSKNYLPINIKGQGETHCT